MSTKLFIGALARSIDDAALQELFTQAGTVVSAKVITDRDTGQAKGFGFVEMSTKEEAQQAITMLNGKEIDGRQIAVNEAKPMGDRPDRGRPSQGRPVRNRY